MSFREPGFPLPLAPRAPGRMTALVVGGTYEDRVSMLSAEPQAGRTTEITSSVEILGGPGLCLAVAMRRLGMDVVLTTALGSCASSRRASAMLRAQGVEVCGPSARAQLDRSELYVAPSGRRVVFSTHALSGAPTYARYATTAVRRASVLVIGSPTPLAEAARVIAAARPGTLKVALFHSSQIREIAAGHHDLLRELDVVCVAEDDAPLLQAHLPYFRGHLITTFGADGARVTSSEGIEVHVPQTDVVDTNDTNGAGEAFCAALTCSLAGAWRTGSSGLTERELTQAVEAAHGYAAAHLRAGGNLAFPSGAVADFARVPAGAVG